MTKRQPWEEYEGVAAEILAKLASNLGLETVEGKQELQGLSGTSWEIDAKGVAKDKEAFVVIECKRYTTSKLNQELIAGVAYRITDTGASGGIVVSPLGLQEGAALVAKAGNIISVRLGPKCTRESFTMEFLGKVFVGAKLAPAVAVGSAAPITASFYRGTSPE